METLKINAADFLNQKNQKKRSTVVDLRTTAELNSEFLAGCLHLPLHNFNDENLSELLQKQGCSADEKIYLLCGSGQRAIKGAEKLTAKITNPVLVVEGGIGALKQLGCEIEQGKGTIISLERQVRIAAGSLVLLGALLGVAVNPVFYALSAFVGAGLVFAGITDTCAMGLMLARMPWNK